MMSVLKADARRAWISFLGQRAFTHAVTLKPNYRSESATEQFLRAAFVRFHRDVDQFLLGSRYHKPSKRHLRTEAVGVMEGMPFVGHIHAMFRVSPERWTDFEGLFRPLATDMAVNPKWLNPWAARINGGTSAVERLHDADGWFSYATKHFADIDASDRVMFLPFDA